MFEIDKAKFGAFVAQLRKDDELRGIVRELRQEGYINVKWAAVQKEIYSFAGLPD